MATYTYTQDPSSSKKDEVRFLTQDIDLDNALMGDEEIEYLLIKYSDDANQTALAALTTMLIKLSATVNESKKVGDLSITKSSTDRFNNLVAARDQLAAQTMRLSPATPYAGGMSKTDMDIDRENDDIVQPNFSLGMDDDRSISTIDNGLTFARVVPG